MAVNQQNQVINGAQKPTCIAQMFCHDLTPGGPNSTVLVLGGGSGSEVLGALQNGNSVVCFEKDGTQFRAMQARIEQALGAHTAILPSFSVEEQPNKLIVEPVEYAWQQGTIRHFDRSLPPNSASEFGAVRKKHRQMMRQAKLKAAQQEEEEEVKTETTGPGCYVCGSAFGDSAVFSCERCKAQAHENCQDGDGTFCLACAELEEKETIERLRAEEVPPTQPTDIEPDAASGDPIVSTSATTD
jgi:hypothetical protein